MSGDVPLIDVETRHEVVSSNRAFDGRVLSVLTEVVDLGDGQRVERDFIAHPGAVGIVAVDDGLSVLLVRQYRHPVGATLWEPPAGLLDVADEDPLDAAKRELFEETGCRAREWAVLVDAFTSPGGSDESVRIYLARGLSTVADEERYHGDAEERDMPTRWFPLADVGAAVLAGRLHNPLAIMGILAAATLLLPGPVAGDGARSADAPWFRTNGARRR